MPTNRDPWSEIFGAKAKVFWSNPLRENQEYPGFSGSTFSPTEFVERYNSWATETGAVPLGEDLNSGLNRYNEIQEELAAFRGVSKIPTIGEMSYVHLRQQNIVNRPMEQSLYSIAATHGVTEGNVNSILGGAPEYQGGNPKDWVSNKINEIANRSLTAGQQLETETQFLGVNVGPAAIISMPSGVLARNRNMEDNQIRKNNGRDINIADPKTYDHLPLDIQNVLVNRGGEGPTMTVDIFNQTSMPPSLDPNIIGQTRFNLSEPDEAVKFAKDFQRYQNVYDDVRWVNLNPGSGVNDPERINEVTEYGAFKLNEARFDRGVIRKTMMAVDSALPDGTGFAATTGNSIMQKVFRTVETGDKALNLPTRGSIFDIGDSGELDIGGGLSPFNFAPGSRVVFTGSQTIVDKTFSPGKGRSYARSAQQLQFTQLIPENAATISTKSLSAKAIFAQLEPEEMGYRFGKDMSTGVVVDAKRPEYAAAGYYEANPEEAAGVLGITTQQLGSNFVYGRDREQSRALFEHYRDKIVPRDTRFRDIKIPFAETERDTFDKSRLLMENGKVKLDENGYATIPNSPYVVHDRFMIHQRYEHPGSSQVVGEEVMRMLDKVDPQTAKQVRASGTDTNRAVRQMMDAGVANFGSRGLDNVVTLGVADLQRYTRDIGEEYDTSSVEGLRQYTDKLMNVMAGDENLGWKNMRFDLGNGNYMYSASINALQRNMSGGVYEGEEAGALGTSLARYVIGATSQNQEMMIGGATDFVQNQEKVGRSDTSRKIATGSFGGASSIYRTVLGDTGLSNDTMVVPDADFAKRYGFKIGSDRWNNLIDQVASGELTAGGYATRNPLANDEVWNGMFHLVPQSAYLDPRMGGKIQNQNALIASQAFYRMHRTDTDGDLMQLIFGGEVQESNGKFGFTAGRANPFHTQETIAEALESIRSIRQETMNVGPVRQIDTKHPLQVIPDLNDVTSVDAISALRKNARLKGYIGKFYNVTKGIEALSSIDPDQADAASKLHKEIYGITQVPKELGQHKQHLMSSLFGSRISGWTIEGDAYGTSGKWNPMNAGLGGAYKAVLGNFAAAIQTDGDLDDTNETALLSQETAKLFLPKGMDPVKSGFIEAATAYKGGDAGAINNWVSANIDGQFESRFAFQSTAGKLLAGQMHGYLTRQMNNEELSGDDRARATSRLTSLTKAVGGLTDAEGLEAIAISNTLSSIRKFTNSTSTEEFQSMMEEMDNVGKHYGFKGRTLNSAVQSNLIALDKQVKPVMDVLQGMGATAILEKVTAMGGDSRRELHMNMAREAFAEGDSWALHLQPSDLMADAQRMMGTLLTSDTMFTDKQSVESLAGLGVHHQVEQAINKNVASGDDSYKSEQEVQVNLKDEDLVYSGRGKVDIQDASGNIYDVKVTKKKNVSEYGFQMGAYAAAMGKDQAIIVTPSEEGVGMIDSYRESVNALGLNKEQLETKGEGNIGKAIHDELSSQSEALGKTLFDDGQITGVQHLFTRNPDDPDIDRSKYASVNYLPSPEEVAQQQTKTVAYRRGLGKGSAVYNNLRANAALSSFQGDWRSGMSIIGRWGQTAPDEIRETLNRIAGEDIPTTAMSALRAAVGSPPGGDGNGNGNDDEGLLAMLLGGLGSAKGGGSMPVQFNIGLQSINNSKLTGKEKMAAIVEHYNTHGDQVLHAKIGEGGLSAYTTNDPAYPDAEFQQLNELFSMSKEQYGRFESDYKKYVTEGQAPKTPFEVKRAKSVMRSLSLANVAMAKDRNQSYTLTSAEQAWQQAYKDDPNLTDDDKKEFFSNFQDVNANYEPLKNKINDMFGNIKSADVQALGNRIKAPSFNDDFTTALEKFTEKVDAATSGLGKFEDKVKDLSGDQKSAAISAFQRGIQSDMRTAQSELTQEFGGDQVQAQMALMSNKKFAEAQGLIEQAGGLATTTGQKAGSAIWNIARKFSSPFSTERAMMSRAWNAFGKDTFQTYIPAAAQNDLQNYMFAAQGGDTNSDFSSAGYGLASLQNRRESAEIQAGRAGYDVYGGMMELGTNSGWKSAKSVFGPTIAAGAMTGIGIFGAGASIAKAGMGLFGGAVMGAAAPIGAAVLGIGATWAGGKYVGAQYDNTPGDEYSALARANGTDKFGSFMTGQGYDGLITSSWASVGYENAFKPQTSSAPAYVQAAQEREAALRLQGNAQLGEGFADLDFSARQSTMGHITSQLVKQGDDWALVGESAINNAISSMESYSVGYDSGDYLTDGTQANQNLRRAVTTGVTRDSFLSLSNMFGSGRAGTESLYEMTAGMSQSETANFQESVARYGGLANLGFTAEQVANYSTKHGDLDNLSMMKFNQIIGGGAPMALAQMIEGQETYAGFSDGVFEGRYDLQNVEADTGLTLGTNNGYDLIRSAVMRGTEAPELTGSYGRAFEQRGVRGIQELKTTMDRGYEDTQIRINRDATREGWGFSEQSIGLSAAGNALSRAGSLGGSYNGYEFYGSMNFQSESMANSYNYQLAQQGIQGRRMGIGQTYQDYQLESQWTGITNSRSRQLTARTWANEDLNTQEETASSNNNYQMAMFNLSRSQSITQRDWSQEDFAISQSRSARDFGWNMEDMDESIRFATGRQRANLLKQKERSAIRYNESVGDADRGMDRQEELWELEDTRYQMQKDHMTEQDSLQEENYDKQRERLAERQAWEDEDYTLQVEQYDTRKTYQLDLRKLENEGFELGVERLEETHDLQMRQFNEQKKAAEENFALQDAQLGLQREKLEANKAVQEELWELEDERLENNRSYEDNMREINYLQANWNALLEKTLEIMNETLIASGDFGSPYVGKEGNPDFM